MTVFEYICHYGPDIVLVSMATSETGPELLYCLLAHNLSQLKQLHQDKFHLVQLTFQK